jgi:hypothetical protein
MNVPGSELFRKLCPAADAVLCFCLVSNLQVAHMNVPGSELFRKLCPAADAVLCFCLVSNLQVAHMNVPGSELFRKLRQLKSEKGGLTSQDERHFAQIRRSLEAEVLAHADVVSICGVPCPF